MTKTAKKRVSIALVLDKSGSMDIVRDVTIDGVNEFIGDQKNTTDTDALFLLVPFSTEVEMNRRIVPVAEVQSLTRDTYRPSGWTALLDAVAVAVKELETYEADAYLVCIVTDGKENYSRNTSYADVQRIIREREALGNWTFTFLGANVDAWNAAQAIGIRNQGNVGAFRQTAADTRAAFRDMSAGARSLRSSVSSGISPQSVGYYSDQGRDIVVPDVDVSAYERVQIAEEAAGLSRHPVDSPLKPDDPNYVKPVG